MCGFSIQRRLALVAVVAAGWFFVAIGAPSPARADDADKGWINLFDGKTLTGWHKNPEKIGHGTGGRWVVEDGAISGEQDPPGSGNGGILLTDRKFADFELEFELNPDWGPCSGLFLRSNDKGQCFQMMIDYHEDGNVGHIYGEGSGGFNNRPFVVNGVYDNNKKLIGLTAKSSGIEAQGYNIAGDDWVKAWKVNEWNRCKVTCRGNPPTIVTFVNDVKVTEFDGKSFKSPQYDAAHVAEMLGPSGSIALQVHGGTGAWPEGTKVRWRKIRVRELK